MPQLKVPAVVTEELFRIGDKGVSLFTLGYMLLLFVGMLAVSWLLRAGLRRALRKGSIEAAGGDLGVADRLIHYGFILAGVAIALSGAGKQSMHKMEEAIARAKPNQWKRLRSAGTPRPKKPR